MMAAAIVSVSIGGWRLYARWYARDVARRNSIAVTRAHVASYETALNEFALDAGRYPTTAEGLAALVQQPPGLRGWKGPYVRPPLRPDIWGNAYTYTETGGGYRVASLGPDGKPATRDDIVRSGPAVGSGQRPPP
jgi:type II secretion system protein G